jgi:hypothetical protein
LALASARAISAFEPADGLRPVQRVEIILDAQHRRRVDGLALEDAFDQLAALGHAEDLRQRPGRLVALQPLDRARREHEHAVRRLAAQRLLPGEGDDVELGPVEPARTRPRSRRRSSGPRGRPDPVGVGDAHARGGAVPGEDDVGSRTASLNVAYNCIDRHLPKRADQTAIIWEGDDPRRTAKHITYAELHERSAASPTCSGHGVKKGDRVTIYLPMIPEAAYAMLACARIGAIHSVVFGGFSPDSARRPHRGLRLGTSSSPPTRACAAAARCRSRPMSTRR